MHCFWEMAWFGKKDQTGNVPGRPLATSATSSKFPNISEF